MPQSSQTPLPHDGVAEIQKQTEQLMAEFRERGTASLADLERLKNHIDALAADSNHWYSRADYFRESYRLVKGYTDDELNALIALDEATKPHRRPCRWPSAPDCICAEAGDES